MVLTQWLPRTALLTVLTVILTGCGDGDPGSPGPWDGRLARSGNRVSVRGAQWRGFPEWQTWAALTDRAEIAVEGQMTVPGESAGTAFSCRLVRLSGKRYSLSFQAELNGFPLILRGEADFQKRSAALDLRGRFAPAQYDAWFGIEPRLRSGTADIRGSLLLTGGAANLSMPALTVTPVGGAGFRLGPFPLRKGRFDRREMFDGRMELDFYGMYASAGGVRMDFSRVTLDRNRAAFQMQLTPPAPWQSTVKPRGSGECSLDKTGSWQVTAELPEPGVFRLGGAILPLRDLRVSGGGDAASGSWEWSGDGASMTLQLDSGTGTGNEIRAAGSRDFRFSGNAEMISRESFTIVCGNFERPFAGGQLKLGRARFEMQRDPAGFRRYQGRADEIAWHMRDSRQLKLKNWRGSAELVQLNGRPVTPEPGTFQCDAVEFADADLSCRTGAGTGTVLLQEKAWKIVFAPKEAGVSSVGGEWSLPNPELVLSGLFGTPDRCTLAGRGRNGAVRSGANAAEYGEWDLSVEWRHGGNAVGDFAFAGKNWKFRSERGGGEAARIEGRASLLTDGRRNGRFSVEKLSAVLPDGMAENLSAVVPFGTAANAGGRIAADKLYFGSVRLAGLAAEMLPGADGAAVKGRARDELTGGICFIAGNIRPDLKQGSVEYQIPAATLRRELPLAELAPLPGNWIFSGKVGGGGQFFWRGLTFDWRKKSQFSGFARNADCMAEDLSGDAETSGTGKTDIRILFRRLIAGRHEAQNGELHLAADRGPLKIADAKFSAWGGAWTAHPDGDFTVKGIRLDRLLTLEGWSKPFSGTFSGKVRLDDRLTVRSAELSADAAGVLRLSGMEPYRLLPVGGFRTTDLAFAEAAAREFLYKTLKIRLRRRSDGLVLRISGEGRPARPVPFAFDDGVCRPARPGEAGFAGEVEIGCGYRIGNRDLGLSKKSNLKGVKK